MTAGNLGHPDIWIAQQGFGLAHLLVAECRSHVNALLVPLQGFQGAP